MGTESMCFAYRLGRLSSRSRVDTKMSLRIRLLRLAASLRVRLHFIVRNNTTAMQSILPSVFHSIPRTYEVKIFKNKRIA